MNRPLRELPALAAQWASAAGDYVNRLCWSPDGRLLAVATADGAVAVHDACEGRLCWRQEVHGLGTTALAWSPDGKRLASGGQDNRLCLWAAEGSELQRQPAGRGWVGTLAWSAGGVLASIAGRELKLWDDEGRLQQSFEAADSTLTGLQWLRGGQLLTAGYGMVARWQPGHDEPVRCYPWKASLLNLAVSPDEQIITAGCQEGAIHLWYANTGEDFQMSGYPTKVRHTAWSADSRYFATGGGEELIIWDCAGAGPKNTEPDYQSVHQAPISAIAFSHGDGRVASGGEDGQVFVYDARARMLLGGLTGEPAISALAWQPGDALLALGDAQGGIRICSVPTAE
ncbi:WD domain, G-beta repeat [Caballeronia sordidicola]|uniref:WD domain, G-beta repeat n=1 Tax=Caballeronia sordidicola TaxID=196367 RepID=A0A158IDI1_CABSO|nr:PD40 domain-containing protein [Caballeronia sordidicola]SAL54628.1 WD domain, G-beta repeat [Caballeronia sordidicola]